MSEGSEGKIDGGACLSDISGASVVVAVRRLRTLGEVAGPGREIYGNPSTKSFTYDVGTMQQQRLPGKYLF